MKTITALIALATSFSSASESDCPWYLPRNENLRQFGTSCYQFYLTQNMSQDEAQTICFMMGGHLVDIHSQSEQDFIIKSWQELRCQGPNEDRHWLIESGLVWTMCGQWLWSSDYPGMNYQNWGPNLPTDGYECCVMEYSGRGGIGKWNEYYCNYSFGWLCEYKITNKSKT